MFLESARVFQNFVAQNKIFEFNGNLHSTLESPMILQCFATNEYSSICDILNYFKK